VSSVADESTELTDMLLPTPVAMEALVAILLVPMLPVTVLSLVARELVVMLAGNLNTEGFLPLGGSVVDFFMADCGVSMLLLGALLCILMGVCRALLCIWLLGDSLSRMFSRLDLCCCCANNSYGPGLDQSFQETGLGLFEIDSAPRMTDFSFISSGNASNGGGTLIGVEVFGVNPVGGLESKDPLLLTLKMFLGIFIADFGRLGICFGANFGIDFGVDFGVAFGVD